MSLSHRDMQTLLLIHLTSPVSQPFEKQNKMQGLQISVFGMPHQPQPHFLLLLHPVAEVVVAMRHVIVVVLISSVRIFQPMRPLRLVTMIAFLRDSVMCSSLMEAIMMVWLVRVCLELPAGYIKINLLVEGLSNISNPPPLPLAIFAKGNSCLIRLSK